jgi:hypothetical protein
MSIQSTRPVQIFMDVPWLQAMVERFQAIISEPNSADSVNVAVDDQSREEQAHVGFRQYAQILSLTSKTSQAANQLEATT